MVSQSHHPAQFLAANLWHAPDSSPVAVEFAFADAIRFFDAVAHAIALECHPWILVLVAHETEDAEVAFCSLKRFCIHSNSKLSATSDTRANQVLFGDQLIGI